MQPKVNKKISPVVVKNPTSSAPVVKPRGRKGQIENYHNSKGTKGSIINKALGGRFG